MLTKTFACFLLLGASPVFAQNWRIFDNFNLPTIRADRWTSRGMCDGAALDCERQIRDGALHDRVRVVSAPTNDSQVGSGEAPLYVKEPAGIFGVGAYVAVVRADFSTCSTSSLIGGAAGLRGVFFNAGSRTSSDDVWVDFSIAPVPGAPGQAQVGAIVLQGNPSAGPVKQFLGATNLGTVKIGERVKLSMRLDRPNQQFVFTLERFGKDSAKTEQQISYAPLNDIDAPVTDFKLIYTSSFAQDCSPTPQSADTHAVFDSVSILK